MASSDRFCEQILSKSAGRNKMKMFEKYINAADRVQQKAYGKHLTLEKKVALATTLNNTKLMTEATNTANIPSKTFFMDMLTSVVPNLITPDIVSTQALEAKADIIMLAAPVYWANVPAIVKNLFDRMSGTSMEETNTFPKPRLSGKRYILFTACNTPMPFAKLCGQTTGLEKAVREYFKTSGVKHIGTVICANASKNKVIPEKINNKIHKLVSKISR